MSSYSPRPGLYKEMFRLHGAMPLMVGGILPRVTYTLAASASFAAIESAASHLFSSSPLPVEIRDLASSSTASIGASLLSYHAFLWTRAAQTDPKVKSSSLWKAAVGGELFNKNQRQYIWDRSNRAGLVNFGTTNLLLDTLTVTLGNESARLAYAACPDDRAAHAARISSMTAISILATHFSRSGLHLRESLLTSIKRTPAGFWMTGVRELLFNIGLSYLMRESWKEK
jgi:hypothetical protein